MQISSSQDRRLRWQIFTAAFAIRILYILLAHTFKVRPTEDHFEFGWEMGRIGRSLATGHGYGNPFTGLTGPTAWVPPGYTLLVGGVFKIFGIYSKLSAFVLLAFNSLLSAWTAVLCYEIGLRCFGRRNALWSGWLWALYPAAMQYAVRWIWEMSTTAFLFTAAIVLVLRMRGIGDAEPREQTWQQWIGFGLLWGAIAMVNPSPLTMLPILALYALTAQHSNKTDLPLRPKRRESEYPANPSFAPSTNVSFQLDRSGVEKPAVPTTRTEETGGSRGLQAAELHTQHQAGFRPGLLRQRLLKATVAGLLFLATIAPWTARNYAVFHRFIPLRDNFGAENYQGNSDWSTGFPWGRTVPLENRSTLAEYTRMGEPAWCADRAGKASEWIRTHHARFVQLSAKRAWMYWAGVPKSVEEAGILEYFRLASFQFLSLCGLLGVALALMQRKSAAWIFAAAFLLLPLPYYLVTVQARFRHTLEPLICVLGVFLFQSATRRVKSSQLT